MRLIARPTFILQAFVACGLTLVPLHAAAHGLEEAPGEATTLHRLGADAAALRFVGEVDMREYPVFLSSQEAESRTRLHVAFSNAVSVMSEASRLRVSVNDVPLAEASIASPASEEPGSIDIDVPPGLLEPGYNAVRIEVNERHRVDCSIAATYELWTQIDPATTGFSFRFPSAGAVPNLSELASLAPTATGAAPLRIVIPPGTSASALGRTLRAVESVAIRGRFLHPAVEVVGTPLDHPGLDIVAGTSDELAAAGLAGEAIGSGPLALVAGSPGHSTLVISGSSGADVDAAIASLVVGDMPGGLPGSSAGLRAWGLSRGSAVQGGSVVSLRDLGVSSQEFAGRLFRTGFDVVLPPDFYAADYGKMTLRINAGYAAGLNRGSQILVRVNDRDAAALPLPERDGDVFRGRPISVPLSNLRPGFNHVEIEAQVATPDDAVCAASTALTPKKRFVLLDDSTLELPGLARIAHLPSLSATAASGFALSRAGGVQLQLYLPGPDADTVAAAATFLSRAAVSAGAPLPLGLSLGLPRVSDGSALVIGSLADLGSVAVDAVGLDARSASGSWSLLETRAALDAGSEKARPAPQLSPKVDLSGHSPADGDDAARLFTRWSRDTASSHWLLEPVRNAARSILSAIGPLDVAFPGLAAASEHPYLVAPDDRLILAQHAAPAGGGATWTVLVAPSSRVLMASVLELTSPSVWNHLNGRLASLDRMGRLAGTVPALDTYFIASAPLTPSNLRLIAAGWLSSSPGAYVLCFLLLAGGLGVSTAGVVKRYGAKS